MVVVSYQRDNYAKILEATEFQNRLLHSVTMIQSQVSALHLDFFIMLHPEHFKSLPFPEVRDLFRTQYRSIAANVNTLMGRPLESAEEDLEDEDQLLFGQQPSRSMELDSDLEDLELLAPPSLESPEEEEGEDSDLEPEEMQPLVVPQGAAQRIISNEDFRIMQTADGDPKFRWTLNAPSGSLSVDSFCLDLGGIPQTLTQDPKPSDPYTHGNLIHGITRGTAAQLQLRVSVSLWFHSLFAPEAPSQKQTELFRIHENRIRECLQTLELLPKDKEAEEEGQPRPIPVRKVFRRHQDPIVMRHWRAVFRLLRLAPRILSLVDASRQSTAGAEAEQKEIAGKLGTARDKVEELTEAVQRIGQDVSGLLKSEDAGLPGCRMPGIAVPIISLVSSTLLQWLPIVIAGLLTHLPDPKSRKKNKKKKKKNRNKKKPSGAADPAASSAPSPSPAPAGTALPWEALGESLSGLAEKAAALSSRLHAEVSSWHHCCAVMLELSCFD